MAKKRILHKLNLDEISGVDRMAQEGATVVLMKNDDSLAKGAFMDAVAVMEAQEIVRELWWELWESDDAMHQAIYTIQNNPERYPDVQSAIIEALGEYSEMVQQQAADAANAVPNSGDGNPSPTDPTNKSDHSDGDKDNQPDSKEDDMKKTKDDPTVETLTKDLEGVNGKLAKAEAYGKLSDAEKTHHNALDEDGQTDFMKMDEGARANVLTKANEADSVVYTSADGEEFRKSDDPRLVKMAKQVDEDRKLAKADRERAEGLELTKRADDELTNLPGETPAKVALLKAVDGIDDESTRKAIGELLKAGNDSMKGAFLTKGTQDAPTGDAETQLDVMAKAYAKENSVPFAKAYDEVLKTDEGEALYSESQKS